MTPDGSLVLREHYALSTPYLAPRTATEQRLAEIWQTVLGMDRVGIRDHYSDLGGDSFMATVIFLEIEASFGVAAPLAKFHETLTVESLATRLDALGATASPAAANERPE
jgi:acyl carrier protein